MKTLKYILILFLALGTFHSCLVDDETKYDDNDKGQNLAGFELNKTLMSAIADGTEYTFPMKVKIVGPTVLDLSSDVTVTFAVDGASTAIEGTHYRIDDPVVTLTAANNYLGVLNVSMLTAGILTPLAESPVLIVYAQTTDGDAKVVANEKQIEIAMNFACFSEFQGIYDVVHTRASSGATFSQREEIKKIGVEQYYTASVGVWNPQLNPPNGFIFDNACNVISVPAQYLADMYGNDVFGHKLGNVDPVTGVITIYYSISLSGVDQPFTAVYTPVP
jgi:hypothetical protein